mmetsp:Transcript_3958/g.17516  ORF Transcript_3958/g.17516 Transcript_3958/m.17516 type:complete len:243 (-) Transcript_3958:707-1435(-)
MVPERNDDALVIVRGFDRRERDDNLCLPRDALKLWLQYPAILAELKGSEALAVDLPVHRKVAVVLDVEHPPRRLARYHAPKLERRLRQRHPRTHRGAGELDARHVSTRRVHLERFRAESPGHRRRERNLELLVRLLLQIPALAGAPEHVVVVVRTASHLVAGADQRLIHQLHRLLHAPSHDDLAEIHLGFAEPHVWVLTHRGHRARVRLFRQGVAREIAQHAHRVDDVDGGVDGGKLGVDVR